MLNLVICIQVDYNLSLQEIKMQALNEHTQSKNFIDLFLETVLAVRPKFLVDLFI